MIHLSVAKMAIADMFKYENETGERWLISPNYLIICKKTTRLNRKLGLHKLNMHGGKMPNLLTNKRRINMSRLDKAKMVIYGYDKHQYSVSKEELTELLKQLDLSEAETILFWERLKSYPTTIDGGGRFYKTTIIHVLEKNIFINTNILF